MANDFSSRFLKLREKRLDRQKTGGTRSSGVSASSVTPLRSPADLMSKGIRPASFGLSDRTVPEEKEDKYTGSPIEFSSLDELTAEQKRLKQRISALRSANQGGAMTFSHANDSNAAKIQEATQQLNDINKQIRILTEQSKTATRELRRYNQQNTNYFDVPLDRQENNTPFDIDPASIWSAQEDARKESALRKAAWQEEDRKPVLFFGSIGQTANAAPGVLTETAKEAISLQASEEYQAALSRLREAERVMQEAAEAATETARSRFPDATNLDFFANGDPAYEAAKRKVEEAQASVDTIAAKSVVDRNSPAMKAYAEARDTGARFLEGMSPGEQFLGQTALSIGQNLAYLPTALINPSAPLVLMGVSAAADKSYELNAQGVPATESLIRGAVSGGIEAATEKIPLENVLSAMKGGTGRTFIENMLRQAGLEATEEGISYAANYVADKAANDPSATFSVQELVQSAAAGGLSGLFFGLGGSFIGSGADVVNARNAVGTNQDIVNRVNQRLSQPGQVMVDLMNADVTRPTIDTAADGAKNTASTGETVNENGLTALTDLERVNLSSGKRNKIVSTFQDAVSFVRNALANRQNTDRAYLGKIPDFVSRKILEDTGLNVKGFGVMMNGDDVRHIMKNHGDTATEQSRGQIAITPDDIARIPEILSSPDLIYASEVSDGKGRAALIFEKQIGDYYITIQGISDGKRLLQTDTLYKRRTRTTRDTMPGAQESPVPVINAQGEPPQSSSINNILPGGQNVNIQDAADFALGTDDPVNRLYGLLGESGKRSIAHMYDGMVDMDLYVQNFVDAYLAGLAGREKPASPNLTQAQSAAAYFSGQNDAEVSLTEEQKAHQYARSLGSDSGLGSNRTKKTYTAEQISEAVLSQGRQAILQDNRMKIVRRKVSSEWRMEVTGQNLWYLPRQIRGIITERINYDYRYFIPTGASGKAVLQDLIGINPVLEIRAGEPEVDQMVGRTGRARGDGLHGKPGNDTMGEIERSLKEDQKNGEAREETRESFLRRAAGEGYAIFEGKTAAYGYRRPVQLGYEASSEQVRRELKRFGITGIIVDGSVIWNQNGLTRGRVIKEATTAHKEVVFINGITTLPPRNVAGHEAFHLWKNGAGKDAYIEALEDNLLFASQAFLKYQEQISKEYLGGEADLADDVQLEKLREELFAYISGDIHEGTNDDLLRPMFRDYDAVKAAWESLVRENTSTKETEETEFFSRDANVGSDQWTTTRVGDRNVTPKTLSEIFEDVRQKFGINITTGHVRGAGVKGTYNRRTEGVRTKIANDLPTLSHEIGHHLDNMYGLTDNLRGQALSELVNNLGDDMRAAYSKKKWKTEGLAEFVRKFLQNREVAAIDYPEFTKYFMETLTGSDAALVYQLADEINAYFAFGAQSAAGNIRFREEKGPDGRTLAEKIREKGEAFYQAWVDANHGIKRFDDAAGSEVYKLAANSAYSDAVAANIIVHDLRNQDGQYVGPGLSTVLSGINLKDKTEYRAFGEYLVVKHGPERLREGMRVFADDRQNSTNWMKARQAELEEQYPQFAEASGRLYEFQRSLLQTWGVETGLVSQDSAEQWGKRWKYYVPLNRAMGDKRTNGARRGYANQNSTIKRAKGSGRDIVHPVDNVINNMVAMVNAGVRNNVMRKITDTAMRKGGLATFLEQVPTPMKQKKFNAADLKRGLSYAVEESSLSGADKDVMNEIISNIDDILIQYGRGKAFGDVVTVMKGGKPEFWKINDTGLLQSITSMSPTKMDGILDAYAVVSRFITGNITGKNLLWSIFSNAPRDLMTFFTYSKDKNPLHVFGSMGAAYVNKLKGSGMDPLYAEYLAMGGGQTSAYTADRNLAKKARNNMTGSRAEWLNPLEWIAFTSDMIEMGPRFATYKMMRQKGMNPPDAFYEAMDITVNFRRGGRLSRELNKVVPFFNASVQGLDKFSRWVRGTDAPRVERGKVVRTRMIAYLLASAALAALFYGINNGDDDDEEDYQQLSNFTKNTYWLIPLGDGKYFAIPKPRELAVLASFFETCMEALAGENPHAFDEFFDYLADNAAPPVVSDLVKGDWQGAIGSLGIIGTGAYIMANRDFLGKPIESAGLSNLEPKDRYNERTSQIAKAVGEALNVSPQKVDYFFNAVFGGFWKTQKALFPVGGESVDKTLGIQNTYIKDNQYSTDLVNWLYDQAELSAQKSNSDPDDMDKAIQKKMDSNMTSFYSRYYALSKNVPETTASRGTRQLVLDMIREYQKATEQGSTTRAQEIVYDVCRESGSTKYLPSAVQQSIKDTNGVSHTLSDAQYVEYQTDYLRIYWETVESAASMSSSMEERKEAILSAKSVAEDAAKSRALKRIGVRAYDNSVLDTGTLDLGEIAYFNSVYNNTGSDKDENGNSIPGSKQDKIIDFMEGMNLTDEEWNYLWHSVYTSDKNNPRK